MTWAGSPSPPELLDHGEAIYVETPLLAKSPHRIAFIPGCRPCFASVSSGQRLVDACLAAGGGLPVGAYGGRRDIMEMVAPAGPMYQVHLLLVMLGHLVAYKEMSNMKSPAEPVLASRQSCRSRTIGQLRVNADIVQELQFGCCARARIPAPLQNMQSASQHDPAWAYGCGRRRPWRVCKMLSATGNTCPRWNPRSLQVHRVSLVSLVPSKGWERSICRLVSKGQQDLLQSVTCRLAPCRATPSPWWQASRPWRSWIGPAPTST